MDSPTLSLAAEAALEGQLRQVEGCDDPVQLRGLCKALMRAIAVQRVMTAGAMGLDSSGRPLGGSHGGWSHGGSDA